MGGRGVAPVVDIAQARARRGAQVGRGQIRRVLPGRRAPRIVMAVDWEAYGRLGSAETLAVESGERPAPQRVKKLRRAGVKRGRPALVLSRAQRRLAWKVERRGSGVAWAASRSCRGELAPVIPIGHRGMAARLRLQPDAGGAGGGDLLDEAV